MGLKDPAWRAIAALGAAVMIAGNIVTRVLMRFAVSDRGTLAIP